MLSRINPQFLWPKTGNSNKTVITANYVFITTNIATHIFNTVGHYIYSMLTVEKERRTQSVN